MEITVIQAILIGISCWLGSVENPQPLGVAFSDALSKPIVGGTIVGMILGDIPTGVTIGAAIQAMYLGQVLIGGVATADMAFVSYPSIALAMLAGADATVAVTLAATVGVLGAAVFTGYEILCSVFYQLGDKYIPYLLLTDYAQKFYNANQHGIKNSFRLDSIGELLVSIPPEKELFRILQRISLVLSKIAVL